ncbi:fructosamine kinase family protein [Caldimonas brevitalea]|uniref:Transferase n=1 Tax=Caldimonas brevitalea TaxID=413882 RepID=A0A0G3BHR7_9BURK|nr:fructosamine kinase family protein [Caldimonas brevitalea]AKJ27533.1 transferase [Caldimonas brevitalea]
MTVTLTPLPVLDAALGAGWSVQPLNASGFCRTWRAQRKGSALFVKAVPPPRADVLEAEADGLAALAATGAVRVPDVAYCGAADASGAVVLALEWLELRPADAGFGPRLGRAVAALHDAPCPGEGRYGWRRDNRIGATLQSNRWSEQGGVSGWIDFWGRERLNALARRLAEQDGSADLVRAVAAVVARLPAFFADGYQPRPALIHGDLWSGNWGLLPDGTPVLYDPAVSCSDPEAELAMMELFGHPPPGFWEAYREVRAVHAGYAQRRGLYQLYHVLNHALMFGGGYRRQALALAQQLVQQVGR